jgi:hypothetical protein
MIHSGYGEYVAQVTEKHDGIVACPRHAHVGLLVSVLTETQLIGNLLYSELLNPGCQNGICV